MSIWDYDEAFDAEDAVREYADGVGTREDVEAALDLLSEVMDEALTYEDVCDILHDGNLVSEEWEQFLSMEMDE